MRKPILGGVAVLGLLIACSSKTETRGQLMLSMQTDLSLPKDVDTVRIEVSTFGKVNFAQDYPVGPNGAKIPATLGVLAGSDKSAPVRIRIIAKLGGNNGTARLLREAVTTVPGDRVANLRMPLQYLSLGQVVQTGSGSVGTAHASGVQIQGVGTLDTTSSAEPVADPVQSSCGPDMTSDNGTCVSVNVDSEKLPEYVPAEVFGGGDETGAGGVCFDTVVAMDNAADGVVNQDECAIYRAVGANTNVSLLVATGKEGICNDAKTKCFVPLDGESESGWRSDGAKIVLPPAVCKKLKDGSITSVLVSDDYFVQKKPGIPTCGPWSGVKTPASADGGAPIDPGVIDAGTPDRTDATTGGGEDAASPPDAGGTGDDAGGEADSGVDAGVSPTQLVSLPGVYSITGDGANLYMLSGAGGLVQSIPLKGGTVTSRFNPLTGFSPSENYAARMSLGLGNSLVRTNPSIVGGYFETLDLTTPGITPAPAASGIYKISAVTVSSDRSTMYWYQSGSANFSENGLSYCTTNGCPQRSLFYIGEGSIAQVHQIVADGSRVAWVETSGDNFAIRYCDATPCTLKKDAGSVQTDAAHQFAPPQIALSGSDLFYTDLFNGRIVRVDLLPANPTTNIIDDKVTTPILVAPQSTAMPNSVFVAPDGYMYWSHAPGTAGEIRRVPASATTTAFTVVASGQANPGLIWVDKSGVYWANYSNPASASVMRMSLLP